MRHILLFVGYFSTVLFLSPVSAQSSLDIQGHRGCRGLLPENTIPAFIHALELGVTTLELDVVVSKDGKLVVSHEPFLSPIICTNPEGEEITAAQEKQYNLYRMSYEEIRQCDCGSLPHPRFPEQKKMLAYKPLLVDVIDTVERYIRENKIPSIQYNIETKSSKSGDNIFHPAPKEFAALLLDVIQSKGIADRTIVQSFDVRTLQEARQMAPNIRQALLVENRRSIQKNIEELGYTPQIYSPYFKLVSKKLRDYTRQEGMLLIPWTVNQPEDIEKMIRLEVDGIISDYPDRVVEAVQ